MYTSAFGSCSHDAITTSQAAEAVGCWPESHVACASACHAQRCSTISSVTVHTSVHVHAMFLRAQTRLQLSAERMAKVHCMLTSMLFKRDTMDILHFGTCFAFGARLTVECAHPVLLSPGTGCMVTVLILESAQRIVRLNNSFSCITSVAICVQNSKQGTKKMTLLGLTLRRLRRGPA